MTTFDWLAGLVSALLGGLWGWRVGTKRIYRRSLFAESGNSTRHWRRRWEIQRYWLTLLYAAAVSGGIAVLMMLAKR